MDEYLYHVESGQFSFDFRAPLLGDVGDQINIYDFDPISKDSNELDLLRTCTIQSIDRECKYVECSGDLFD